MQDKYIIIGCGGHAKSVADVILDNEKNTEIIFLDENAQKNEKIFDFPVLSEYKITNEKIIVALGDNQKRVSLSQKYYDNLTNIISKRAYIGKDVQLGRGIFIGNFAHIGTLSFIDDFCLINTKSVIEHECILKEGAFIAPSATLCGKVLIGSNSFIGASSTVIDNICITNNVIVGANSTVINNIDKQGVYAGSPVKNIKRITKK